MYKDIIDQELKRDMQVGPNVVSAYRRWIIALSFRFFWLTVRNDRWFLFLYLQLQQYRDGSFPAGGNLTLSLTAQACGSLAHLHNHHSSYSGARRYISQGFVKETETSAFSVSSQGIFQAVPVDV